MLRRNWRSAEPGSGGWKSDVPPALADLPVEFYFFFVYRLTPAAKQDEPGAENWVAKPNIRCLKCL